MVEKNIVIVASGLSLAASSLFVPKVRRSVRKKFPRVTRVLKRADNLEELKAEAKGELTDHMRDKFKQGLQSKVNDVAKRFQEAKKKNAAKVQENAVNAKKTAQNALLKVRENVSGAKEAGVHFQEKIKNDVGADRQLSGVNDIKGINNIKGSTGIKSSTKLKGPSDIKHPAHTI